MGGRRIKGFFTGFAATGDSAGAARTADFLAGAFATVFLAPDVALFRAVVFFVPDFLTAGFFAEDLVAAAFLEVFAVRFELLDLLVDFPAGVFFPVVFVAEEEVFLALDEALVGFRAGLMGAGP